MCALYDLMDSSSFSLFLSCLSLSHTHEDGYNLLLCFGLDEKVKKSFRGSVRAVYAQHRKWSMPAPLAHSSTVVGRLTPSISFDANQ